MGKRRVLKGEGASKKKKEPKRIKTGDEIHQEAVQRDICACLYFILTILYICTLAYVCFYVVPADEDEMFRGARAVMVGVYGMVILCCGHCIYIMTNGQYRHENGLMWTTQEEKMERMAQLRDQAYEKAERERRRKNGSAKVSSMAVTDAFELVII